MNRRQARWKPKDHSAFRNVEQVWKDFGEVTHVEAASKLADSFSFPGDGSWEYVETREEGSETIYTHKVTRHIINQVTPLRHDDASN